MNTKYYHVLIYLSFFIALMSCNKVDERMQMNPLESKTTKSEQGASFKINNEESGLFACKFMSEKNEGLKNGYSVKSINNFALQISDKFLTVVNLSPDGFVLMSNDTRHFPVYAFSKDGEFALNNIEQLFPGQKEWVIETFLLNLELENDSVAQKENGVTKMWQTYLGQENNQRIIGDDDCVETFLGHVVEIYDNCVLSTHWSQNLPYSLNTPICSSTDLHKPTGCVATAMAQVMNYWEHPANYDWNILLNTYPPSSTTTSAWEVAGLMRNIGDEVNMNYGCNGSSATSNAAKNAFKDDFGYSSSITLDDYHIDNIMQNLQWGYPVLLGGYRTRINVAGIYIYLDGHEWVTDGLWEEYDNYEVDCLVGCCQHDISYIGKNHIYYLHMNWGWGNTSQNVWYYSNNLTHPNGTTYDYKWNKDMIINIHP